MSSGLRTNHAECPVASTAVCREFSGRAGRALSLDGVELFLLQHRAPIRNASHLHESAHLSWLLRGDYRDFLPGGWRTQACFEVVVRPPKYEHQDRIGQSGATFLCARLTDAQGLLETVEWPRGPKLLSSHRGVGVAAALYHWLASGRTSARGAGLAELVHEVIELACARREPESHVPSWLRRARERVRGEFRAAPRLIDLAREAQVHPGYLARAYRHAFGMSPAQESRMLRDAAFLAELSTDRPIAELAHELGYADQAHACRTIKLVWGEAPAQLRRQLLSRTRRSAGAYAPR